MGRRSHSSKSVWEPAHAGRIREDLLENWGSLRRTCETLLEELESLDGPLCSDHVDRRLLLAEARPRIESALSWAEHATLTLPHASLAWVRTSAIPVVTGFAESYDPYELLDILDSASRDEVGFVLFETSAGYHRTEQGFAGSPARDVSIDGLYWYPADVVVDGSPAVSYQGFVVHVLTRHRGLRRAGATEWLRPSVVQAASGLVLLTPKGVRAWGDSLPIRLMAGLIEELDLCGPWSLRVEKLDSQTSIVSAARPSKQ